eukprot:TRINITY_DN19792_c0_g1_i1.p2 TRINITY_DN19792_c0_g1~~TRINITY_DN19792_c0_g1_i1.p2  ORF type:complete len:115 (+),score=50.13 TRINITY_DN19792_c0_g1_i1:35-346(+)
MCIRDRRKAEELMKAKKEEEDKAAMVKKELQIDIGKIEESKRISTDSPASRESFAKMFLWAIKKTTASKQLEIATDHRIVKDGKVIWKRTHFILAIELSLIHI